MNPILGWGLALAALVAGWIGYRWPGVALAVSVIVFWLLLQFSRSLRVLRDAGKAPVGSVPSAVMLHSKLRPGLLLMQVVSMTKSLGRRISVAPEVWSWADDGGASVHVTFVNGRCTQWLLQRPDEPAAS